IVDEDHAAMLAASVVHAHDGGEDVPGRDVPAIADRSQTHDDRGREGPLPQGWDVRGHPSGRDDAVDALSRPGDLDPDLGTPVYRGDVRTEIQHGAVGAGGDLLQVRRGRGEL